MDIGWDLSGQIGETEIEMGQIGKGREEVDRQRACEVDPGETEMAEL